MRPFLLFLLLLVGCQTASAPPPNAAEADALPMLFDPVPLDPTTLPMSLIVVTQVHGETVDNPTIGHFRVEQELLDTIEAYDDEMERLGWKLVDVLQFGDGGFLRRYYRQEQRAILAFEPEEGGTQLMLMQGQVR